MEVISITSTSSDQTPDHTVQAIQPGCDILEETTESQFSSLYPTDQLREIHTPELSNISLNLPILQQTNTGMSTTSSTPIVVDIEPPQKYSWNQGGKTLQFMLTVFGDQIITKDIQTEAQHKDIEYVVICNEECPNTKRAHQHILIKMTKRRVELSSAKQLMDSLNYINCNIQICNQLKHAILYILKGKDYYSTIDVNPIINKNTKNQERIEINKQIYQAALDQDPQKLLDLGVAVQNIQRCLSLKGVIDNMQVDTNATIMKTVIWVKGLPRIGKSRWA